jgi:hypothetical protein
MIEKREIVAIIGSVVTLVIAALLVYWEVITMPMFTSAIAYVLAAAFFGFLVWGFKPRINRWLKKANESKKAKEIPDTITRTMNTSHEGRGENQLETSQKQKEMLDSFISREAYYSMPDHPQREFYEPFPVKFVDAVDTGYYEIQGQHEDISKIENDRKKIHGEKRSQNDELVKLIKPLYLAFDDGNPPESLVSIIHLLAISPEMWNDEMYKNLKIKDRPDTIEAINLVINTMRENRELAQAPLREMVDKYLEMRRERQKRNGYYGSVNRDIYYEDAWKLLNKLVNLIEKRYHELTDIK